MSKTLSDWPVYLIIGASGGVGSDLAVRLSQRGSKLVLAGPHLDKLAAVANSVDAHTVECDVRNFDSVKDTIDFAFNAYGRLDGVALCAGTILLKPAHLTTEDEWSDLVAVNLSGAFATVKYASKKMMSAGGSIVLVSSCAAQIGLQNHEAIAATKAGVEGLVRSAAATYSRSRVRVNCVAPGLLNTKMTASITSNEAQHKAALDMHPLGRIGRASDVSAAIDWLLGEESSWITGQCIAVDGGLSATRVFRRASSS
ncbi:MAG: SDR family oxidoreductase [Candidatus Obscuribacterales bacterium]|nr:SDR family oxidoreductase [Candidatus Obscuribacterales bacterium]